MSEKDSAVSLEEAIGRYNDAWNAHDLDAIMAMHAPDMVFENHTAGESASGDDVRTHIAAIFGTWPDIHFDTRHQNTMKRGDLVAEPTGKVVTWKGIDVIPFEDGLVKRKDVYSDSVSILSQVGLLA